MNALLQLMEEAIAADERAAQAAWHGNGWRHEGEPDEVWTGRDAPGHTRIPICKAWNAETAEHIARSSPVRARRRAAGYRQLLAMHGRPHQCTTAAGNGVWVAEHPDEGFWIEGHQVTACDTLIAIADELVVGDEVPL